MHASRSKSEVTTALELCVRSFSGDDKTAYGDDGTPSTSQHRTVHDAKVVSKLGYSFD